MKIFIRQTLVMTKASMMVRYRQSFAGFLWVIINPILMFAVQSLVFKNVLKINMENFYLFLASALIPWLFATQTLEMTVGIFVNNARLIKAYSFNPLVLLTAQVLDNFINSAVALVMVLAALKIMQGTPLLGVFLAIPSLLVMLVGIWGLCTVLAVAQIFFRDVRYVLTFALSLGFFLTPIFYPVEFLPEGFRWLPEANPIYIFILPVRQFILLNPSIYYFQKSLVLMIFLVAMALVLWRRFRNEAMVRI